MAFGGGGGGGGGGFNPAFHDHSMQANATDALNLAANLLAAAMTSHVSNNQFNNPMDGLMGPGPQGGPMGGQAHSNWREQVNQRGGQRNWNSGKGLNTRRYQGNDYQRSNDRRRSSFQNRLKSANSQSIQKSGKAFKSAAKPVETKKAKSLVKNETKIEKTDEKNNDDVVEVVKETEKTVEKAEPSEVKEVKKTEDKKEDNENEDVVEVKEDPKSMYAGLPKSLLTCQVCNKSAWNGMSFQRHVEGRGHGRLMEMLEKQIERTVDLLREHIKILETRREVGMERMKKRPDWKVSDTKSFCTMCDIEVIGSMAHHRRALHHQQLKDYLHPKCAICQTEHTNRMDWYQHCLSESHLKKLHEKGIETNELTDIPDVKLFEVFVPGKPLKSSEVKKKDLNDDNSSKEVEEVDPEKDMEEEMLSSERIADFQMPEYDAEIGVGKSFLKPVNGFFCPLCKKFLHSGTMETHIKTKAHFNKFVEAIETKKKKVMEDKEEEQSKKRASDNNQDKDDEGTAKKKQKTNENQQEAKEEGKDEEEFTEAK